MRTRPALGLAVIWDDSYGERIWEQAKLRNLSPQVCCMCLRHYPRRSDRMWRCVRHPTHAHVRLCSDCVRKGAVFLDE